MRHKNVAQENLKLDKKWVTGNREKWKKKS